MKNVAIGIISLLVLGALAAVVLMHRGPGIGDSIGGLAENEPPSKTVATPAAAPATEVIARAEPAPTEQAPTASAPTASAPATVAAPTAAPTPPVATPTTTVAAREYAAREVEREIARSEGSTARMAERTQRSTAVLMRRTSPGIRTTGTVSARDNESLTIVHIEDGKSQSVRFVVTPDTQFAAAAQPGDPCIVIYREEGDRKIAMVISKP